MTWLAFAETLLAAGAGASLTSPVARQIIAPGPSFARDCRMMAVYPELVAALPSPTAELPGQGCAVISGPTLHLVFVADCWPMPDDDGEPPDPAELTAWSEDFLVDAEAIWNAIADAAIDGTLGDCDSVSIDQARFVGPTGGIAQLDVPVRLLSL